MKSDTSSLFPRDFYGRLALATSALFFVPIGSLGDYMFLVKAKPKGLGERLMIDAAGNLLLALALFFICGLVWAVTTPRWIEDLLGTFTRRLLFALMTFVVPFSVSAIWAIVAELH
jgi:hypothetical protein